MLKADLHMHAGNDPFDGKLHYSEKDIIDHCAEKGLDVISITNHARISYGKELVDYAASRGVLLIPGVELRLEGKDILVYDVAQEDIGDMRKISDLRKLKGKLVIAPHPYYIKKQCLGKKMAEYIDVFDAVESCMFYYGIINPNRKAVKAAKKFRKPMAGSSDAHSLWQIGTTYSLIDSPKDKDSVIRAVKQGKIRVVSRPAGFLNFCRILARVTKKSFFYSWNRIREKFIKHGIR